MAQAKGVLGSTPGDCRHFHFLYIRLITSKFIYFQREARCSEHCFQVFGKEKQKCWLQVATLLWKEDTRETFKTTSCSAIAHNKIEVCGSPAGAFLLTNLTCLVNLLTSCQGTACLL